MDEDAAESAACSHSSAFFTRTSPAPTRVFSLPTTRSEPLRPALNGQAEAAIREKQATHVSLDDFREIAARKTSPRQIPLAAVCCRYDRLDLLEPWCAFYDRFAGWQQMLDDTFDWVNDLRHGNATYSVPKATVRNVPGSPSPAG